MAYATLRVSAVCVGAQFAEARDFDGGFIDADRTQTESRNPDRTQTESRNPDRTRTESRNVDRGFTGSRNVDRAFTPK
jgi:hypothetical protein